MTHEEIVAKLQELDRRVQMIERERKAEAKALKEAKDLQEWKKLVPGLDKYFPQS